ncbi:MAG: FliH/SctL family protein [Dehalobacterium sp.]
MSNSKVMKSWDIEEESHNFVLTSEEHTCDDKHDACEEQAALALLDQAKVEAQRILDQAYLEGYEKGQQKGYQEGYKEGYKAGLKAGESEGLKKTEDGYRQALEFAYNIEKLRREMMMGWEKDVKMLAMAIGEKIINTQVNLDEQTIVQITKKALGALISPKWINLYVNPRDGEQLIKQKKIISEEMFQDIPLKIIKTPDLPLGSCHMETDKGILDASIAAQILEVKKVLEIA